MANLKKRRTKEYEGIHSTVLDEVDIALIKFLGEDGRRQNNELAKLLNVTEVTVANRLKKLRENRYMKVVGVADMHAFGYKYHMFVRAKVVGRELDEIVDEIKKLPDLSSLSAVIGNFDLLIVFCATDLQSFHDKCEKKLLAIEGLTDITTEVSYDTRHYMYLFSDFN